MADSEGFSVDSERRDDEILISVRGDLDLASAPRLREACDQAVRAAPTLLRLDLGGLTFLDSSGISVLVEAHRALEGHGAGLVLHGVDDRTQRVLDVAGLGDFFERSDRPAGWE